MSLKIDDLRHESSRSQLRGLETFVCDNCDGVCQPKLHVHVRNKADILRIAQMSGSEVGSGRKTWHRFMKARWRRLHHT